MHKLLLLAAAATLVGCSKEPAEDANAAAPAVEANAAAPAAEANAAAPALASINSTTWEFVDAESGKPIRESIDASGNYIAQSGTEHFDHGTAVMKDGKACFTSAMNKDGEMCWTDPRISEGQSGTTTSDKGETLTVKRVAYVPMTM